MLEEISGRDAVTAFTRAAQDWIDCQTMVDGLVASARVLDPQGRLHVPVLRGLAPLVQRAALRGYLLDHGIAAVDRNLLERALVLLDATAPAVVNLPGGGRLRRRSGRIWVEPPARG